MNRYEWIDKLKPTYYSWNDTPRPKPASYKHWKCKMHNEDDCWLCEDPNDTKETTT